MVSSTLLAVIGTLAGSLVGATITGLVNYYTTVLNQENQDRRYRAEHYLEKKVEYLAELHESLIKCDNIITGIHGHPEMNMWREYEDEPANSIIQESFEEFKSSATRASIFLSEEQQDVVVEALIATAGAIETEWQYEMELIQRPPSPKKYQRKLTEAKDMLRKEINEPVSELE